MNRNFRNHVPSLEVGDLINLSFNKEEFEAHLIKWSDSFGICRKQADEFCVIQSFPPNNFAVVKVGLKTIEEAEKFITCYGDNGIKNHLFLMELQGHPVFEDEFIGGSLEEISEERIFEVDFETLKN